MFDQRFDKQNFGSISQRLMWNRTYGAEYENTYLGHDQIECIDHSKSRLTNAGGIHQQDRMIRDKRRSLDRAVLYSYQGALVKKIGAEYPVHALINPNKLKQDYDDKILSVGFEFDFHSGDVFEWVNTNSYWIIYLQDLTELAYFRGDIRRCCYIIDWIDENGDIQTTYAAVRGPVETKIEYLQKHGISLDRPNYSLNLLLPKNEKTMQQFQRYSKFYLKTADEPDKTICWRVEATDSISTPGILEINAVEYYANETEDDIQAGLVGAKIEKLSNPNEEDEKDRIINIVGEDFIKPKKEYIYSITTNAKGQWWFDRNDPVITEEFIAEDGSPSIKIKWKIPYSGEFILHFGKYQKVITIQSLF